MEKNTEEERKKGQLAGQGDREIKDGRKNRTERERQEKQREEAGHKDSKRKKGQGYRQRWRKTKTAETQKKRQKEQGIEGQIRTAAGWKWRKKPRMVNRTKRNRNMGRERDKGI